MERSSQTTTKTAFSQALTMLQQREYSACELTRKLARQGFSSADIDVTLTRLQAENLQSDTRFSEQYIHSRARRGYGPVRIAHELFIKGIDKDLIDLQLTETEIDWQQQAIAVRVKRFGESVPKSYPARAKQLRFMESRGFGQQLKALFSEEK